MGSSSKRKHSKKKSSKLSSKARKLKKSKRTKAKKKLGRRHDSSTDNSMSSYSGDSYSLNSDDDSISYDSLSSSSSKDAHRRKSNVSRSRSTKKRKKQVRRRSSSREDSWDLSRARKRKRSKKNSDSKSNKNSKRKKLRRDLEISSVSSDSSSCSTCNDSISAGESSEGERVGRRSRKNKDGRRDKPKRKIQSTLSPQRVATHSSYSEYRDENYAISQGKETYTSEKNSRRLKSVIVFAEKSEPSITDQNESEKDLLKEELVYEHYDYPSKSSSGEGSKKVPAPHPSNMFDGGQSVENVGFDSDNDVIEQSIGYAHEHEQDHVRNPSSGDLIINSSEKERICNFPLPDSGSSGNDLEAVLKQKALENLKKFRQARKTNEKPTADGNDQVNGDHIGSSSSQTDTFQSEFPNHGCTEVEKDASGGGFSGKVSKTTKQNPDAAPGLANCGKPIKWPVLGKSAMENTSFGESSSGVDPIQNPTRSSVVSVNRSHMETETSLRNTEPKIAQLISPSITTSQGTASTSALVGSEAVEKPSSNNQQDEVKDASQYQQKTMSVMRNGEMVQVNYKVYIPQRAPALARRQFKR